MPRYIKEYEVTTEGAKLTVPTCTRYIGVERIGKNFRLITEVWGNDQLVHDIDVRVFHEKEYILPESTYLGYALAGAVIFHFSFTAGEVIDLGGDGGVPEDYETDEKPKHKEIVPVIRQAGGMKES